LQAAHLPNIFPSQKAHFSPLFLPVPLQKEQIKLEVPKPLQLEQALGSDWGGGEKTPADWPEPEQAPHLPNIFPSQKAHFSPLFLPVPLQKEQEKLEVPEPLHAPHSFANSGKNAKF